MKLIDQIRAGREVRPPHVAPESKSDNWKRRHAEYKTLALAYLAKPELTIIKADNVAKYFYDQLGGKIVTITPDDFPCLAPPFDMFWIEYPGEDHTQRFGIIGTLARPLDIFPPAKWHVGMTMFVETNHCIYGPLPTLVFHVLEDGTLYRPPDNKSLFSYAVFGLEVGDEANKGEHADFLNVAMLTMCFMNCKNVKMVEEKASAKLIRRTEERHGITPRPHHVLVIEPLKEVLRKQGNIEKTGLKMALHICRGHFSDYTEGRGLFGKHHGRYFIPAHVKARRKDGGGGGEEPPPREIEVKLTKK